MCRVNVRVGLQQKEKGKKERQGGGRRKEAVHTKKKVGGGGCRRGGGRFMGDVYYYTALPRGDGGRGAERKRQNIPFPLPLLLPIQKPHRGWRALSPEEGGRGGFTQERCIELGWNKHGARKGAGFTGSTRRNVNRSGCRGDSRPQDGVGGRGLQRSKSFTSQGRVESPPPGVFSQTTGWDGEPCWKSRLRVKGPAHHRWSGSDQWRPA